MQPGHRSNAKLSLAIPQPATATERREPAIQVSNLSIVFDTERGQLIAVDRVSFDVPHGEFVCIVGPSGCGKSTVLNTIAGLEVPFSCKSGVCCTCRAKLLEGEVRMERNFALEKHEVAAGFVLTCQSHPLTERVVLSFDER